MKFENMKLMLYYLIRKYCTYL